MTSSLADPARTGLWITDFGPVRRAMMHRMSFDDLPDNWPELPLTDQRLLADVLDLVVSEQSRRDGALYVLLCDEHARLMQPMAIDLLEAPDDPDARRQLMASVIDVTKHLGEKGSYVVAIARRGGLSVTPDDEQWAAAVVSTQGSWRLLGVHVVTRDGSRPVPLTQPA